MKTIRNVPVDGKKVLVRVDFDVPLKKSSSGKIQVAYDGRIKAVLPTLQYLIKHKAKVIIMSHLGRPGGKFVPELRLDPVTLRLQELLGKIVIKCYAIKGRELEKTLDEMNPGEVVMLDNLRFYPGEEKNEKKFAKNLAGLGEIYVDDAFAVSHRAHASVEAITHYLPSYAGFLMEKEVKILSEILQTPEKPFLFILGGAKAKDKIPVLEYLKKKVDSVLLGGVVANNYIAATTVYDLGATKVEREVIQAMKKVLQSQINLWSGTFAKKFLGPIDAVVSSRADGKGEAIEVEVDDEFFLKGEFKREWMILDIGPETIENYKKEIAKAKTILWNGNMGMSEVKPFDKGTLEIAKALAEATGEGAKTIVCGGDTTGFVNQIDLGDKMTYLSTGGGAALEFLAGKTLPGVAALG